MLQNATKLADVIKIDVSVLEGLANVFIALSCKLVVDPVMFGALADEVEELLIKHISWHPGIPSIHLNILHGR